MVAPKPRARVPCHEQSSPDPWWWDETVERYADAPSRQLRALLEGIGEQIASPQFRGCPFINLANEFPDREHPGTVIACANKREMCVRSLALSARAIPNVLEINSRC
jgi:hypothetical protein